MSRTPRANSRSSPLQDRQRIVEKGSQDTECVASHSLEEVRGGHGELATEAPPGVLEPLGKLLYEHHCILICLLFACGMSLHSALLNFLEPVEDISPSKIDSGDYARGCYEALPSIVNIALDALPHFIMSDAGSRLVDPTESRQHAPFLASTLST